MSHLSQYYSSQQRNHAGIIFHSRTVCLSGLFSHPLLFALFIRILRSNPIPSRPDVVKGIRKGQISRNIDFIGADDEIFTILLLYPVQATIVVGGEEEIRCQIVNSTISYSFSTSSSLVNWLSTVEASRRP